MSTKEKDGVIYFGQSKKYQKRGITVVSLKGDPYEMGYAHGVLLKEEMKPWVKEALYWARTQYFGTSFLENIISDRAKEVKQYIPEQYIAELKGLAAGSGFDYEFIMVLNIALDTAWSFFSCTSIAVKGQDGKLIRSRGLEFQLGQGTSILIEPHILFINQSSQGYAFASVQVPGMIGATTAMNETGLNLGLHSIAGASSHWKGVPNGILDRKIIEYADSVEEVGDILKKTHRAFPTMIMVTDLKKARIYEYDSADIGYKDMDEDGLVLTNYTRVLNIGRNYYCGRYQSARSFLNNYQNNIDIYKLVELLRDDEISCVGSPTTQSYHSAIFVPETLDFWIAVDPPPANRGRWVGFNLKKELDGSGHEPNPLIIPAGSGITIANRINKIKVNEKEPWTGKWKVEASTQVSGIWAMKQEGKTVRSTRDSAYDFKGKVLGNRLKGKVVGAVGYYYPLEMEMPSNKMSFTGTLDWDTSNTIFLKGKRIE
jgi:predicted choloylglycine hydrolase